MVNMITVNDIVQYYYCPRKVYFLKTLGVPYKPRKKMEYGEKIQKEEREKLKRRKETYGIPKEEVAEIQIQKPITDQEIELKGTIDALIKTVKGEIIPVEIKYTDNPTIQYRWRKQLAAYALLAERKHKTKIRRGILYFPLQKKTIQVEIQEYEKKAIIEDIQKIKRLITSERIPRKVEEEKCQYCEMKRYCI